MTPAQELNYLETHQVLTLKDPLVTKTDSLLNILSEKFDLSKDSIAIYTYRTEFELKKRQISSSAIELMAAITEMYPNQVPENMTYIKSVAFLGSFMAASKIQP